MILEKQIGQKYVAACGQKSILEMKPVQKFKSWAGFSNLKYMPRKLQNDVVELEQSKLQELSDRGLSLNDMATALGVTVGKIRMQLEKFNIVSGAQKKFRILKEYFTATTEEDKARAFTEIDKYLEPIAKEMVKSRTKSTYEDCLQDVRLQFFEMAKEKKENGISFPYGILQEVRKDALTIPEEIETVRLNTLDNAGKNIPIVNDTTEIFESEDFCSQAWNDFSSFLSEREFSTLYQYIKEERSLAEIAEQFGILPRTLEQNTLNRALHKVQRRLKQVVSDEYIQQRSEIINK